MGRVRSVPPRTKTIARGRILLRVSALLLAIQFSNSAGTRAATFQVTSTADNGSVGTLRWAITQANAAGAGTQDRDVQSTDQ